MGKPPASPDWHLSLAYLKNALVRSLDNAALILAHDDAWRGRLAWDAFAAGVTKVEPPPCDDLDAPAGGTVAGPWTDEDTLRTTLWLARTEPYRLRLDPRVVDAAVRVAARRYERHAVREYLAGLAWDGVARLDTWLVEYCGAVDTPYVRAVGARTLISAVARVAAPGCKVDNVLVLEGAQGAMKSTAARILGAAWFTDTAFDPGQKDAFLALRGAWIIELGELDRLSRTEAARIKAFVSSPVDTYRPPYGRHVESFPRQCVFIGTCNHAEYLPDSTGNRRWWPVRVSECDVVGLGIARDQLWAEARVRQQRGEPWWMTRDEERELCAPEQEQRRQRDPWEDPIAEHCAGRDRVTTGEILANVLTRAVGERSTADEMRVSRILQLLGYQRRQRRIGLKRAWFYELSPTVTDRHQPPAGEVGDGEAESARDVDVPSPTSPTETASHGRHTDSRAQNSYTHSEVGDVGDRDGGNVAHVCPRHGTAYDRSCGPCGPAFTDETEARDAAE